MTLPTWRGNVFFHAKSRTPEELSDHLEYMSLSPLSSPDFGVDPDFSHCVDGLVIVDLARLHERKRRRYLECNTLAEPASLARAA